MLLFVACVYLCSAVLEWDRSIPLSFVLFSFALSNSALAWLARSQT